MRNIFSLVGLSEQLATVAIIKCWSIHRWQAVLKTSTYISTACHCHNKTFFSLALFICWYKLECLSMTSIFSLVGLSEQTATVAIKCWSVHRCQAVLKTCTYISTGCRCPDKTFLLLALFWYKLEYLSMRNIFSLVGLSEQPATVAIKCYSAYCSQAVFKTYTYIFDRMPLAW